MYKDPTGANVPWRCRDEKQSGVFEIKVVVKGKLGTSRSYADPLRQLRAAGAHRGDSYSINFASGTVTNKAATLFKVSRPTQEGTCIAPNPNNLPLNHIVVVMQENRSATPTSRSSARRANPPTRPSR